MISSLTAIPSSLLPFLAFRKPSNEIGGLWSLSFGSSLLDLLNSRSKAALNFSSNHSASDLLLISGLLVPNQLHRRSPSSPSAFPKFSISILCFPLTNRLRLTLVGGVR